MSKTSFKVYCIENYADYKKISGDLIYKIFKENGILDMLDYDYGDLHGMGKEFLMDYFDKLLKGVKL